MWVLQSGIINVPLIAAICTISRFFLLFFFLSSSFFPHYFFKEKKRRVIKLVLSLRSGGSAHVPMPTFVWVLAMTVLASSCLRLSESTRSACPPCAQIPLITTFTSRLYTTAIYSCPEGIRLNLYKDPHRSCESSFPLAPPITHRQYNSALLFIQHPTYHLLFASLPHFSPSPIFLFTVHPTLPSLKPSRIPKCRPVIVMPLRAARTRLALPVTMEEVTVVTKTAVARM